MKVNYEERNMLRELAKQVDEIAQQPLWKEKFSLWKDKNSLKKVRPLILLPFPEAAWEEVIPEKTLFVQDPYFRNLEWDLKRRIYKWNHLKDDEIITNKIYVPIERTLTDWFEGRQKSMLHNFDAFTAVPYDPVLNEYSDLKKLRYPELTVDWKTTNSNYEDVKEVFGNILDVILGEPYFAGTDRDVMVWGNGLIDIFCELRGMNETYLDLYENPEFVHDGMHFLMEGTQKYLDTMERENLLFLNNNEFIKNSDTPLGSNSLGITDELPKEGFDPKHVTTEHLWGYFQAQEFSDVSPEMLEEFVFPYQSPIAKRFGLNCYGCCEPNDRKWDTILKNIPNLRALSVAPWANHEIAAEKLKNNYVYSWKLNVTDTIFNYSEDRMRENLKTTFQITKDCCVVASLRDTQTLYGHPERANKWVEIAMQEAMNV